ncbi:response regulator [Labilibacter marinus]|uniref:response regulator n=1 Tax=Labilibacter marinus TaxID=1477105 RepID=UPI000832980B|nr:response regulator [Labilibacter marinus]
MNWKNELNSRILIVDDIIENLELISQSLQEAMPNCIIYQTNSVNNAIKIAQEMHPDIVLSDWDMPLKDGIDLINELKKDDKTKDIPVIILTGINCDSNSLKVALEAGAVDFLKKPFDIIELQARIHATLSINNEHQEYISSKERELIQNALNLEKSIEFLVKLKSKLSQFKQNANLRKKDQADIDEMLELIEDRTSYDNWNQFELVFQSVHPDFIKKLLKVYPELSMADLKLCVLIRLNISIKNIAYILHIKPESIKVSRSRLRKKMRLEQSQNLVSFLSQF